MFPRVRIAFALFRFVGLRHGVSVSVSVSVRRVWSITNLNSKLTMHNQNQNRHRDSSDAHEEFCSNIDQILNTCY